MPDEHRDAHPDGRPEEHFMPGSMARPDPGEQVPVAVVETIARMLADHWAQFGAQWTQFGDTLKAIQAEVAGLSRVSHDAPCRFMDEHRKWHEEQAKENRTFRRNVLIAILAAMLAVLGRYLV